MYAEEIENDLNINLYSNINIKNEQSPAEILKLFEKFFLKFGRFPAVDTLAIVPSGVVPLFVKTNDILSLFDLYKNFCSTDAHGLVCVQFLAVLNVFLGSDEIISKNATSKFFHNLSMQALNEMDNRVKLKFDAINDLKRNIKNNFLTTEANKSKTFPKEIRMGNFAVHETKNQKFEGDVLRNIRYDFKVEYRHHTDHLTFLNTVDKIKKQAADKLEQKNKLDFALNKRNREIQESIILDTKNDLIKTVAGPDSDIANEIVKLSNFNNDVVELEMNGYDLKNCFEETTNNFIQENNTDIVSKMLVNDIINQSIEELEEETEQINLPSITEIITNGSFAAETPKLRRSKHIAEKRRKPYNK